MVKIGVLTFHRAINYGAVLQAYALVKHINDMGAECEIIDYRNRTFEQQYAPFSIRFFQHPKSLIQKVIMMPSKISRRKKFRTFVEQKIAISQIAYTKDKLESANKQYQLFITGSDQVWNLFCTGNDFAYFLDFVDNDECKCSYAASFAVEELTDSESQVIAPMIKNFQYISVREQEGADIINRMLKRKVEICPDPSFLLSKEEWMQIQVQPSLKTHYILVFCVGYSEEIWHFVQMLQKKTNLDIVYLNHEQMNRKGVFNVNNASPEEWIGWLNTADYVVTNSFHGCAFSILLEKNFFYELSKTKKTNSRLKNLIQTVGLENREICFQDERYINYDLVLPKVEKLRKIGTQYLKKVISKERA